MGAGTVDTLEVKIEAQARGANSQLDKLVKNLERVSSALNGINAGGLSDLAGGVNTLAGGMKNLQGIKKTNFNTLANGIERLEKIDSGNLSTVGNALKPLAEGVSLLSNANFDNKNLQSLINSLTRLGNSNVENLANMNFTALGNSIKDLANSLSAADKVQQSTISMANAIANLAKAGGNIGTVASELPQMGVALKDFIFTMSSAASVAPETISFTQAIGNLANAGTKAATTAGNLEVLSTELKKFMQVMSTAPSVNSNVIQMTNALAQLASQGNRVGSSSKSLGKSILNYSSRAKRATKSTKSLASVFGSLYANFFWVIRGFKAMWSSVESSMDFLETVNYFEVAMRKLGDDAAANWKSAGYDSAETYAQSFSERAKQLTTKMTGYEVDVEGNATYTGVKNLGIDPDVVMNYQAMFAQVSESIGVAEESALNFSDALTMLGADWASLRNTTFEQAWEKFASALAGQSRAVRAFGIDITNATLQEYAYKYGLTQNIAEMNQATKAQLRLLAILDQSEVAYGDLANTMQSPSNQLRMLKQNFANLARTIGNLFLPIVSQVLPYINGMIMALQRLFAWIGGLLGIKFESINSSMGGLSDSMSDLVDDADDYTDAVDSANQAAKKLKTTVLGIDELNINDPDTGSDGSGSGGGGVSAGGGGSALLDEEIAKALAEYQKAWDDAFAKMENKAQDISDIIVDAFKRGDYEGIGRYISDGITKGLGSINWESVYKVANKFGTGLAQFLNGLITPELFGEVGKTIASTLNTVIYTALAFGKEFDWSNLGESIASGINNFFETFDFAALADTINIWVQGIWDTIKALITNIDWGKIFEGIDDFFENIDLETVAIIIGAITIKKIGSWILEKGVRELAEKAIGLLFAGLGIKIPELSVIIEEIKTFLAPIIPYVTGVVAIISGVILAISNFVNMLKEGFSWFNEILMIIGVALAAVGAVILGVPAAVAAVVAAIVATLATIVVVVKENWGAIKGWFADAAEWFNVNVITPICSFFKGLWKSVSGFFSDLWSDIKKVWITVSTWFSESVIEPIVEFFQGLWTRVKQIFEGLWIIVKAVWIVASNWFNQYVITPIVKFFKGVWTKVSEYFSSLWGDIKKVWTSVSSWFNVNVITPITGFFKGVWTKVSGYFSSLWEGIKKVWKNVSDWFQKNVTEPLGNIFDSVTSTISGAFDGVWKAIKGGVVGAMNAVIGAIETAINWIVDGINKIIGGFNKVVSWAAKVADTDWGGVDPVPEVNLSRISAYATGGFPNTGEMFIARENGINEMVGRIGNRNTVVNNDQIVLGIQSGVEAAVEKVLAPYLGAIAQNTQATANNTSGGFSATINIDGRKLVSAYDERKKRNGFAFT